MIDRTRVCMCVCSADQRVDDVCLFYSCHIHNQFDHHLHTLEIKSFLLSFIDRGLGETFTQPPLESYKTSSRSSMLTQVDNRWWSDDGGHWHLLEDHYNTHVKQHAWIHDLLQKSKILFASKFLPFFPFTNDGSSRNNYMIRMFASSCSSIGFVWTTSIASIINGKLHSLTQRERRSLKTHYPHADKIVFPSVDTYFVVRKRLSIVSCR